MVEQPARYCNNCGHELGAEARFCPNCGTTVHWAAHVPTPEADRPVPPIPSATQRSWWQRFMYGNAEVQQAPHAGTPPGTPNEASERTFLQKWWPGIALLVVGALLLASVPSEGGGGGGSSSAGGGSGGNGGGGNGGQQAEEAQAAAEDGNEEAKAAPEKKEKPKPDPKHKPSPKPEPPHTPKERIPYLLNREGEPGETDILVRPLANGCAMATINYQTTYVGGMLTYEAADYYDVIYGDAELRRGVCFVRTNAFKSSTDAFGNTKNVRLLTTSMGRKIVQKVNWDNKDSVNFRNLYKIEYMAPSAKAEIAQENARRAMDCAQDEGLFDFDEIDC